MEGVDIRPLRLLLPILVLLPLSHACGNGGSGPATLDRIDVEPRSARTTTPGDSIRFEAFAVLTDGTREAVDPVWSSSRPEVVEIDGDGWATGLTTGAAVVEATYEGRVGAASFVIDPDTVPPTLLAAFADETRVDLSRGSVTVTITAELRDERSGVGSVLGVFDGPLGAGVTSLVTFSLVSEADDGDDGVVAVFEGFLTIPANTGAGTWTLAVLEAKDRSGNSRSWRTEELEELGLTVEIIASTSGST